MNNAKLILYQLLFILIAFPIVGEVAFRIVGKKAFEIPSLGRTHIEPGNVFYKKDSLLGYTHCAGTYTYTLKDGFVWHSTHLDNTLRITKPLEQYKTDTAVKPEIWIMGCSLTHGFSIEDSSTYPYKLQTLLPNYTIVNYGTGGYGTIQGLIKLNDELAKGKRPIMVIGAYAAFHDERNTLLRSWRKTLYPNSRLGNITPPYARVVNNELKIYHTDKLYNELPFAQKSVFVNSMEEVYNKYEDKLVKSHLVSRKILTAMDSLCKINGVKFMVAAISETSDTKNMLSYCSQQRIDTVDISVPFSNLKYTNLPHDGHPSALANTIFAEKLFSKINALEIAKP